jgi:molybdopterin-guanine dinucleotide biosynthesis protein A
MGDRREPIGVILAGGLGRRLGGDKAAVALQGRPLISYPLAAMRSVLADVAVLAKEGTELPQLEDVTVWIEPDGPTHPLYAITQALRLAEGRPALVCATDLPFVSPRLIARLAAAPDPPAPAVVAAWQGQMQPLLGCYRPAAAQLLAARSAGDGIRLLDAVSTLHPYLLEVEDPEVLFNINAPEDLLRAAAMLDGGRPYPKVKS